MTNRAFSLRLALYGLLALTVSLAVALPLAREDATHRAKSDARATTQLLASMLQGALPPGELQVPLPEATRAHLSFAFRGTGLSLVRLLAPDGRVVYASGPSPADDDGRRLAALRGRTLDARVSLASGSALETVTPVLERGRPVAVLETFRPWGPIAADVRRDVITRVATILVAVAVLLGLLIPVLRRLLRERRLAEGSSREQAALAQALVEHNDEGICVLDQDGRVTFANAALAQLVELEPADVVGRPLADFLVGELRPRGRVEVLVHGASGNACWTLASTHPLETGGTLVHVADIDELKGTERTLHGATRRLAAIVAAQREIAELELDLDAALERLAGQTQELTGADGTCLYAIEEDGFAVRVATGIGGSADDLRATRSLAAMCALDGEVLTSFDMLADDRVPEDERESDAVLSAILVPVRNGDVVAAVLGVLFGERSGFDDEAVETARLMAEFGSATLRNAAELHAKQELVAALAESEQRFRTAVESSPIGFALATPEDRYVVVNEAFCKIVGRTREELQAVTWREITHPEDLDLELDLSRQLIDGEIPHFEVEKRFIRGDGTTVWVRLSISLARTHAGEPFYGVAQIQDVTERRRLEQSVRERERLFRAVFEQSMVAHIVYDDTARIVDANRTAAELAGLPKDELLGRRYLEFAPPGEDFAPILAETLATGHAQGEVEIVTASGRRRTVVFFARANVQPGRHLSLIQDVTEQRHLEERLRQGQKMEAVGRLAGGIAHDFNNMLTAINGYSELLLARLDDGTVPHRHAFEIHQAGLRAASLTRQLLAFSRRQVLQPIVLDLNGAIERMRDMIQRLVGEDVVIEARLSATLEPVLADESQVQQVVVNLTANARDAMPQGGVIAIETATVTVDPEQARDAVATPGRYTRLTISDRGVGMDEAQLAQLFEPFYSTKGEAGVGLGLATVYGIVRQSGGFVTVDSAPGRGSSFSVYLPVTGLRSRPPEQPDDQPAAPVSGTVLLVEDEEIVRAIVTEMLEQSGYRVVAAADGAEAIRLAEVEDGPIDLLMTDVVMPGMSGQEVAQRVAEQRPSIRTLFASGYNDSAIQLHGVLAPGAAFIQKPFSVGDLRRKLRELLEATPV